MRGGEIKCIVCGYRILKKVKPPVVKRIPAKQMKKREMGQGTASLLRFWLMLLEYFFLPDFSKGFASKFYGWSYDFVGLFFDCFSFYGFSADSSGEQSSFYADGVCAVCYVACVFGPFAPDAVLAVHCCVFCAFEGFTRLRTSFDLCQQMHNLWLIV